MNCTPWRPNRFVIRCRSSHELLGLLVARDHNATMVLKKKGRLKLPPVVAAVVRPVSARLSRMENLLIEMRAEQDVKLKKINKLQAQVDELMEAVNRKATT